MQVQDGAGDIRRQEWLTGHLIEAHGVDEELAADEKPKLAAVVLGDEDLAEAAENAGDVGGEWVEVAQVGEGDVDALGAGFLKGITAGAGTFITAPVQGAAAPRVATRSLPESVISELLSDGFQVA